MTFKDLKKRVSIETTTQQQSRLFEILRNKPFWIWDIEEHKHKDVITKGDCCFNHIISLPIKDGIPRPIFDYQKILYDSLQIQDINRNFKQKHLWVKKATGLGVTEFFLRYIHLYILLHVAMAWMMQFWFHSRMLKVTKKLTITFCTVKHYRSIVLYHLFYLFILNLLC
jgi:hypothetical protein